jgi:hypothetical protein
MLLDLACFLQTGLVIVANLVSIIFFKVRVNMSSPIISMLCSCTAARCAS